MVSDLSRGHWVVRANEGQLLTDTDGADLDHGTVGLVHGAIDLLEVERVGDELIASVAEQLENGILKGK